MSIEEMTIDETIDGLRDQMGFGDPVLINAIRHLRAYIENKPLAWEDLKSMEGKPVWVEWTVKGEWHHGDWNLVNAQLDDRVWLVDSNGEEFDLLKEVQGAMWQAYRKER